MEVSTRPQAGPEGQHRPHRTLPRRLVSTRTSMDVQLMENGYDHYDSTCPVEPSGEPPTAPRRFASSAKQATTSRPQNASLSCSNVPRGGPSSSLWCWEGGQEAEKSHTGAGTGFPGFTGPAWHFPQGRGELPVSFASLGLSWLGINRSPLPQDGLVMAPEATLKRGAPGRNQGETTSPVPGSPRVQRAGRRLPLSQEPAGGACARRV